MAPKGGNAKEPSGRSKKSDKKAPEKVAPASEPKEPEDKREAKKREQEEKRKRDLERKAENRSLAEKEASEPLKQPKAAPRRKGKDAAKPAGPGAIAADGNPAEGTEKAVAAPAEVESFSATGLDNALDLMEVVTAKTDKASLGQQAAGLERHPERRFKAAFEAYQEREMPNVRDEHPGLRLQQYKDLLYKQFQKAPENPHNQAVVDYDATKDEKVAAVKAKKAQIEDRLREKP